MVSREREVEVFRVGIERRVRGVEKTLANGLNSTGIWRADEMFCGSLGELASPYIWKEWAPTPAIRGSAERTLISDESSFSSIGSTW